MIYNYVPKKDTFRYEVCLFLPTVEKIQEGAFMTKTPREMMSDLVPIPTLWSMNEKEGLIAFCGTWIQLIYVDRYPSIGRYLVNLFFRKWDGYPIPMILILIQKLIYSK